MSTLKQRMYHLTMYNISEIQKGIQCYHAGIEYMLAFGQTREFKRWASQDKTVIILNGGTSTQPDEVNKQGTMETHMDELDDAEIPYANFVEPDLNNSTTAIAFLCDETVWDKETYPDPEVESKVEWDVLSREDRRAALKAEFDRLSIKKYGAKVAFLREWLKQFRFA